ncbi:MAG: hypothetical protein AAF199_10545 [Pseudomonadota bacterium]
MARRSVPPEAAAETTGSATRGIRAPVQHLTAGSIPLPAQRVSRHAEGIDAAGK